MSNAAKLTPETLLETALTRVESASIRGWASSEHNRPIFVQIAANAIDKATAAGREPDVHRFAAYIMATAIGL